MVMSSREKQAALRERRKRQGLKRIEFWVTPEQAEKLRKLYEKLN